MVSSARRRCVFRDGCDAAVSANQVRGHGLRNHSEASFFSRLGLTKALSKCATTLCVRLTATGKPHLLSESASVCSKQVLSIRAGTSRLGDSLVEALDVLIEAEKISVDLAIKVLTEVVPCQQQVCSSRLLCSTLLAESSCEAGLPAILTHSCVSLSP